MNIVNPFYIDNFLNSHTDVFTEEEFVRELKNNGIKISKENAIDILTSSAMVFSLVNDEYVTRAGVFKERCFSFLPSKEEIQKGQIILGHRCIPFVNPETPPDRINVSNKDYIISSESTVFSMNLAMDTFALFGEGFVIPYIFNDHSNKDLSIASVQYSMPTQIELTSWPLSKISPNYKIKYGDRIIGRVVNWQEDVVELTVLPAEQSDSITFSDMEREEWYKKCENSLIECMNKNGPCNSIEEQLAYLYLEHQKDLCVKNCGSIEEFFKRTSVLGFSPYGVETRIWYLNQEVPYIGSWNESFASQAVYSNLSSLFAPPVIDVYLENAVYKKYKENLKDKIKADSIFEQIFPKTIRFSSSERKSLMLNIEKRSAIIEKSFNQYEDVVFVEIRKRITDLFSKVTSLLCSIACSRIDLHLLPQQELVIIIQLFNHIAKIIEEMENKYIRDSFPLEDVSLSLEGMEDTYEEVNGALTSCIDENTYKNITIIE